MLKWFGTCRIRALGSLRKQSVSVLCGLQKLGDTERDLRNERARASAGGTLMSVDNQYRVFHQLADLGWVDLD